MKPIIYNIEPKDFSSYAKEQYQSFSQYYEGDIKSLLNSEIKKNVNVLIVRLANYIDNNIIKELPSLTHIVSATTGHDHLNLDVLSKKGIKLISLRGHDDFLKTIPSTAEHTWALLMAIYRKITSAHADVMKGNWERDKFKGYQLKERKIGIIGLGRIGKKVAEYAEVFGMKVHYFDPYVSDPKYNKASSIEDLFRNCDLVSIHVHLTEETYHLIDEKILQNSHRNLCIINTSRGKIVNEKILVEYLENNKLMAYATDVLESELENIQNSPVWQFAQKSDKIIITPHIGGATYDVMHSCEEYVASLLRKGIEK